jgi:hypothetical protein
LDTLFDLLITYKEIKEPNDWHSVSVQTVFDYGGRGWLRKYNYYNFCTSDRSKRYNDSLMRALKEVYPDHTWPVKERPVMQDPFEDLTYRKSFIKELESKLSIFEVPHRNCIGDSVANLSKPPNHSCDLYLVTDQISRRSMSGIQ